MSFTENAAFKRRSYSSLPELFASPTRRKYRSGSGEEPSFQHTDHRRPSEDTMKFHILCRMASLAVRSRNARDKNSSSTFGSYAKRRTTRISTTLDPLGRHASRRSESRVDSINILRERVSNSEVAEKRKFSVQETQRLYRKFRMWIHIYVVLAKMQKYYSIDRTDYKNMQFSNLEAIYPDDLVDVNKDNFIFDVSEYKANRQMRMSQEAKRIMTKPSEERTDEEINYAMVAIRSVKQISDYPVMMQRNLAKYGLYLSFEQKRVLIRQDHKPEGFYFLLFGTVAVIVRNKENGICRIVCYLSRGDNFGELAIINKSIRQSTVVTKSYVELLVITEEIYEKVFMAGGAKSLKDPDHHEFIRSLYFLQDWPVYLMEENPKLFLFSYFKRNDVMVKDSCYSDWIYIVKSGAITVLKKLVKVKPEINRKQARHRHIVHDDHLTSFTSHTTEFNRYLDQKKIRLPPPLSISSDESDGESCFDELEAVEHINTPNMERVENEIRDLRRPQTAYPAFYTGHNQALMFDDTKRPPKSATLKGQTYSATRKAKLSKRMKMAPNSTIEQTGGVDSSTEATEIFRPQKRTYVDDFDSAYRSKERVISQADANPEFVKVGVMTKGEVFGLSQMLYPRQPSLCVVSNGADCLMLNKKFYLEHCSPNMLARLRNQTSPYPSEKSFQTNLETRVNWDAYKQAVVDNYVKGSQKLRARSALPRMKFS